MSTTRIASQVLAHGEPASAGFAKIRIEIDAAVANFCAGGPIKQQRGVLMAMLLMIDPTEPKIVEVKGGDNESEA